MKAPLRITRISEIPNVTAVALDWPSSPARLYGIEAKPDLTDTNWIFLGNVLGAAGTDTIQAIGAGGYHRASFRISAKPPLQP